MENDIQNLFSGNFYIHSTYAASCIPSIYKSITSKTPEISLEKLIESKKTVSQNPTIKTPTNKVVVIGFNQPVMKYNYSGWLGTQTYMDILKQLELDETIAGVVLNIDSGGGQVYGTGEIYDFIKNYSKPIVAFTHGYLCSGAYYIAAPCKYIIANKRADAIGSIGAYTTFVDYNGLWEHFGAKVHTLYATNSTEKNAEHREIIENANYEPYIKQVLDPIVETFIQDMKSARPQLNEKVFKGGTWTGEQALELGLIDENGTLQDAINKVYELAQINKSNSNTKMTSKSLPAIEVVLGLESPLAITDNGSFINIEQLESINNRLVELQTENSTLKEQNKDTTALDTATNKLTEANQTITSVEAAVDGILTKAGMTIEGSLTDKLNAINGKAEAFGKADSGKTTNIRVDAVETTESKNNFVDMTAEHNQFIKAVLG